MSRQHLWLSQFNLTPDIYHVGPSSRELQVMVESLQKTISQLKSEVER